MITKSKILLLITNLGHGGAQRVFHDHSVFLSKDYHVDEAVFNKEESENLFKSNNKLFSLDVSGKGNIVNKICNFFKRCIRLSSLIKREGIKMCISHMDGANWVNVLSFSSAKKVLIVHGTILHDHNQAGWMQWLRKNIIIPFVYNRADVTVAVSDGIKYELQKFCRVKNAISIPNYFDIDSIKSFALQPVENHWEKFFEENDVLITSGRFHEQKKQRYLFPLVQRIKQTNSRIKLLLLGDGALRENLLNEAQQRGLSCYTAWDDLTPFSESYDIYFAGYVSNPFQFLARSKMFLFPSAWEGFPMALCEAMISGVPVLASDCPTGPRQILSPGSFDLHYTLLKAEQTKYGWLLPTTDKPTFDEEWYTAIMKMLKHSDLRKEIAKDASERMQVFSKDKIVHQWKELVDSLL